MNEDNGPLRKTRSRAAAAESSAVAGETPLLHAPTLARLLEVLGPVRDGVFLDQLQADLATATDTLRQAVDRADRAALQRASHDLIALAGAVAATELEAAARRLNIAAHGTDHAAFGDPALLAQGLTMRLMADIETYRAGADPAPMGQKA